MITQLKCVKNKHFMFLLFSIVFMVISIFDLRLKLSNLNIISTEKQIFIGITGIILPLLMLSISFLLEKYDVKIEKVFLVLALILGVIYVVASPLFTGCDEHNHYYRVYEITEGIMITPVQMDGTVGSKLPKSLCDMFVGEDSNLNNYGDVYGKYNITYNRNVFIKYYDELRMFNVNINHNETIQYGDYWVSNYVNTCLYNPLQYSPHIIGFLFGKLVNATPFIMGMLGRLFNLLCFVFLGYLFLSKIPYMKEYCMLILLTPTVLSSATTLSADAFTISMIFGLVAYVLYYIDTKKEINIKDSIILFLISVGVVSCKIVYFPLLIILFLIPVESYKSKKQKYILISSICIISALISIIWINITSVYFDVYYLNSQLQKIWILHNITKYLLIVIKTYFWNFSNLLLNSLGSTNMYHNQLPVYTILPITYLSIIAITLFNSIKNKEKFEKYSYYLRFVFLLLLELLLIATALYIQCTAHFVKVGYPIVIGLQGRYYTPLLFLVPFFIKAKDEYINYSVLGVALLVNICILMQMVVRFMI